MSPRRKTKKSKTAKASARGKKLAAKKKKPGRAARTKKKARKTRPRGRASTAALVSYGPRGLGARSGGQAGDTQGVSSAVDVDSESVEELLEEGQPFEAEVVNGVERAPDPDQGEVRTHEVPENDVPEEYRENE
jgi:hypothetical protein